MKSLCLSCVHSSLIAIHYSLIHAGPPLAPYAIEYGKRYRSVRVGWTRPWSTALAPVTSYEVELLQANGSTLIDRATVPVGSTIDREKTFDNLIYNTAYSARVAAVNSIGQGPWSPLVSFIASFSDRMCIRIHFLIGMAVTTVLVWKVLWRKAFRQRAHTRPFLT